MTAAAAALDALAGETKPAYAELRGAALAEGAAGFERSSPYLRLTLDPGIHDHGQEQPVVQGAFIYSDDVRAPQALVKVMARIEG